VEASADQTQTSLTGNTAGVSGNAVVVNANGQLRVTLSSARYKRDIAPMGVIFTFMFPSYPGRRRRTG
jgi:hypothetical protein